MSASCGCSCSGGGAAISVTGAKLPRRFVPLRSYSLVIAATGSRAFPSKISRKAFTSLVVRASAVDSYENSSDFVKRMEQAWLISQQPGPVACSSCASKGHVECKWCGGTGFFVIGNNVLCEVPSRNTSCVICTGKYKPPMLEMPHVPTNYLLQRTLQHTLLVLKMPLTITTPFFYVSYDCGSSSRVERKLKRAHHTS